VSCCTDTGLGITLVNQGGVERLQRFTIHCTSWRPMKSRACCAGTETGAINRISCVLPTLAAAPPARAVVGL